MHTYIIRSIIYLYTSLLLFSCIDPESIVLRETTDILVVDGTITNLAEPQVIRLNRSRADRITGLFGNLPITKAVVEVLVDSAQVVPCHETEDGTYQLPSDFKGQVGHAYQLRFTLSDGSRYESSQQIMQPVPAITSVKVQFNAKTLPPLQLGGYTAGHDFSIESQDPANQHNYYRWEWTLYERQYWCRKCQNGVYTQNKVLPNVYKDFIYFVTGNELYEDCFTPVQGQAAYNAPSVRGGDWYYDYPCRTACWEVLASNDINVFDDIYSNGGLISRQHVAKIPFYDYQPALVDIKQMSMTQDAYRYYKLFADQTQNTGGLADTPPSALMGNVHKVNDRQTAIIGYFTSSAVSIVHYWLDRKDTQGMAFGAIDPTGPHGNAGDDLFYALNLRRPYPEPSPPYIGGREEPNVKIWPNNDRPPTATCLLSDGRTPFKPEGWKD